MLLTVDIGNTAINFAVFAGEEIIWRGAVQTGGFALPADVPGADEAIISSVVPATTETVAEAVRERFGVTPRIVGPSTKTRVTVAGANAAELGADRLADCEAALALYGGPIIVVDYGTATTYDALDADGVFLTGITAPGVGLRAEALFARAALLSPVPLTLPDSFIVADTGESVRAGIMGGAIGETEYIIRRLRRELAPLEFKVAATGGLSGIISAAADLFDYVDRDLLMKGLRLISLNQGGRDGL
ncbi:MAG: type III pantothenate kinase [Clostridiales bacterium]|jgi:type III pantothenate kinase|nr:type III pantothenate kinase [Clostridiales bacterium]